MIVILDRGHGQKPDGFDPGVCYGGLREVDLSSAYITHAAGLLTAAGHTVHLLDTGSYNDRHRKALQLVGASRGIYIQCHVNAGRGTYGLVMHDRRSKDGARAASTLGAALKALPGISRPEAWPIDAKTRGFSCIDGIWAAPKMCGVVYEPGFIDSPEHAGLWTSEGLRAVGEALAAGVGAFAG